MIPAVLYSPDVIGGIMDFPRAAAAFTAALIVFVSSALSAQEGGAQMEPPADEPSLAEGGPVNPFTRGEQLLQLNAGLQIPLFLLPETGYGVDNLKLGGVFSFSYHYFLARGFALGGSISAAFNGTIGDQTVFVLPLGLSAGYWWSRMPFDFCVSSELGAYLMRYNSKGMISPFAKIGGGALWRITSSWSLGLESFFWFIPELHYGDYADLSQYSGFLETSIAAVYHL
jgi:hypothetical protein